jgi:peptidyl-prolyl cis-trans isomerase A (cyclophilin A)
MNLTRARFGFSLLVPVAFALACARGTGDERVVLLDTSRSAEPAPETFRVRFETTKGPFVVQVHHAWAPWGVDRFYYLVKHGFYDSTAFFRVLPGYIAQFGISGNPAIAASWQFRLFPDDTARHQSNLRGRLTFANAGPQSRSTQLFINLRNNPNLDQSYAPIGEIVEGIGVIDQLYSGYGEGPPAGTAPNQGRIFNEGTPYLKRDYPNLDYIVSARIEK